MDVNERLEQNQTGNGPSLKPDEKRLYLGTYRERVILAIKTSQVNSEQAKQVLADKLAQYPNATLLIDQNHAGAAYIDYLQLAIKSGNQYSLLSNNETSKQTEDPYAIVLADHGAVNLEHIEL
ncbi:DUF1694 domain-containing protein [Fructobacillus fructosus]|uniref:DUF2278 family (YueI) n=1 Tax=Fructobacillus fructosus TaxID=1631 RepID=A0ABM9N152_9LACO|nr:DUF1694 domain-containing protein [Fructobacillus fructosus]MBD9366493.1 DUF1694 domain-containing protein [Leuconostoc mesenteroides]MBC9119272.1 DUF1694 domain-containing protein [Fructobacillus fructosus]MCK8638886.1 YueI family protein [Fructobacillus fructosus]CAK1247579.1 DUF2278 family (YueI) [Fructobacillus fructosus]CAK1253424.1 DUF2278 family (YueI) [Fructobacillus fructosus]